MMRRFLLLLLSGTILTATTDVWARTYKNEGTTIVSGNTNIYPVTERSDLENTETGYLETESGDIFHMDTRPNWDVSLAGSTVTNYGTMKTNGTGYAVYLFPLENQRSTTTVNNFGQMYRIDLSESGKSASSSLGEGSTVYNGEGATLFGSVLMGTNANIKNWGTLSHLDSDVKGKRVTLNNLIYFDKNGIFRNGYTESLAYNADKGITILDVTLTPSATVTTDNISFKQSGSLYTAGIINNERILAFDEADNPDHRGVEIFLLSNPYYEEYKVPENPDDDTNKYTDTKLRDTVVLDASNQIDRGKAHLNYFTDEEVIQRLSLDVGTREEVPEKTVLMTGEMSLGDKATVHADQGSLIGVGTFTVGQNANIDVGADYAWLNDWFQDPATGDTYNWERSIVARKEKAESVVVEGKTRYTIGGLTDPKEKSLNPVPKRSLGIVTDFTSGDHLNLRINNTDWNIVKAEDDDHDDDNVIKPRNADDVVYSGSLTTGNDSTVTVSGSDVHFGKSNDVAGSGNITFGDNGTLNVSGYWQEKVRLSDDGVLLKDDPDHPGYYLNEYKESYVGDEAVKTILDVGDSVTMGENANVTISDIEPDTRGSEWSRMSPDDAVIFLEKQMILGDNSTITLGGGSLFSRDTLGEWTRIEVLMPQTGNKEEDEKKVYMTEPAIVWFGSADIILGDHGTIHTVDQTTNAIMGNSITFGDFGRYEDSQPWDPDGDGDNDRYSMTLGLMGNMSFGNDGYFAKSDGGYVTMEQLNMQDRAVVHIAGALGAEVLVGTDSNVYLDALAEKTTRGSGIEHGLFRQEGRTNVNLYSYALNFNTETDRKKIFNENYVMNGVDVDHIWVLKGGLRMGPTDKDKTIPIKGDIHGTIHMDSDTWVRFTGNRINIYDPITRIAGATNTLVWIDVDDSAVVDTRNTIDSDTIMVGGGTLQVHHNITATDIVLDDAGTIRVYDENLVHGNVHEYESSAANTTLYITPIRSVMNSFGTVDVDRLIIGNDTFNARHDIRVMDNGVKQSTEGIWLGTDSTLNAYKYVKTSQIIRRLDETAGTVLNTTVQLMQGDVIVDVHMDVDTLNLKSGTFAFENKGNLAAEGLNRDMVVTNDITVENGVNFLVNGVNHPNSGRLIIGNGDGLLTVNKGARIGLSNTNLVATDTAGIMHLRSDLAMQSGSILDLRSSDTGSDLVSVTGTAELDSGVRLVVRNLKEGTNYHLMHADSGLIASDFETSFRWHDTVIDTSNGRDLYLNIGHISTLKEELNASNASRNAKNIGGYISDAWDGSFGPWDSIFYATTLDEAVKVIDQYIPEGYVNAPQVALRTGATFQNTVMAELNDMRQLHTMPSEQRSRIAPNLQDRSPVYRGRSGGDYTRPMYQPYVRGRYQAYTPDYSGRSSFQAPRRGSYRTDRGGIWAKPFYVTAKQKNDKGISGYDFNSYGLAAGIDRRFGRWTWGISGLYASGDFEQDRKITTTDTSTWGVGLYGSFRPTRSAFFMDLFASYIHNGNEGKHKIESANTTLTADYDTTSLGAGIAFGYDFELARSFYITPKIGFNFAQLSSDEIEEKGTAPIVMRIKNPKVNSLQLPVEVRMAFPVSGRSFELLPEVHLRYTHDFGDTTYESKAYLNGSTTAIKLDNVGMPENLFTLGGSVAYTSGKHEFSGRYDYDFGDGLSSHLFNVGYKFLF